MFTEKVFTINALYDRQLLNENSKLIKTCHQTKLLKCLKRNNKTF